MQKETYLTPSTLETKTKEWLEEVKKVKKHRPFVLDLSKAALLVLDMQKFFLDDDSHAYVPAGKAIIRQICDLIHKLTSLDRPVIFTRHVYKNGDNLMGKWWRDNVLEEEKRSEIADELAKSRGIELKKHHYSAFFGTELEKILRKHQTEQVIITGVMSHLCCETTTREAFMRGFQPFYVVNATATYTEQLHLGSIRAIAHGFGICIDSQEIIQWNG